MDNSPVTAEVGKHDKALREKRNAARGRLYSFYSAECRLADTKLADGSRYTAGMLRNDFTTLFPNIENWAGGGGGIEQKLLRLFTDGKVTEVTEFAVFKALHVGRPEVRRMSLKLQDSGHYVGIATSADDDITYHYLGHAQGEIPTAPDGVEIPSVRAKKKAESD